jgi:uncharacterized UPF0160 family protein
VYKHFGRAVIAAQLGQPEESPDVQTVYLAVYKHFMEAIDGIDNGRGARCEQPGAAARNGAGLSARYEHQIRESVSTAQLVRCELISSRLACLGQQ